MGKFFKKEKCELRADVWDPDLVFELTKGQTMETVATTPGDLVRTLRRLW